MTTAFQSNAFQRTTLAFQIDASTTTTIWGGERGANVIGIPTDWNKKQRKQAKKEAKKKKKEAKRLNLVGLAEALVPAAMFAPSTATEAIQLVNKLPSDVLDALSEDDEEALIFILLAI